jgi:hypothetical protein
MKNIFLVIAIMFSGLFSTIAFSQSKDQPVSLGLPGDNLDLYAVLEIFQQSKTIEDFEKILNQEKDGINNLDLDNDNTVDFIKVLTDKDGDSFSFVLQVAVSKTENQDVAVIFVSKDNAGKPSIQIIGDEDLYGKNYVVEPKDFGSSNTINPGYSGGETMNIPAPTAPNTTVVIQSPPIVHYVYSPAYIPYYPPYYYGFYPVYYRPWIPIMYGVYWSNHYHYHKRYYGGYQGSVSINVNYTHHYNNYNTNARRRSSTVSGNNREGRYKNIGTRTSSNLNNNRATTRPSTTNGNRPSTRPASPTTRQSGEVSKRPTSPTTRQSGGTSTRPTVPSTRQSGSSTRQSVPSTRQTVPSTRNSSSASPSTRQFNSPSVRQSSPSKSVSRPSNSSTSGRTGSGNSEGGRR